MTTRMSRRQELMEASVDDPRSGGLIDGYYTDFVIDDTDREVLERFLVSSDIDVRREALIALIFSTGQQTKLTGYAKDALALHALGLLGDSEARFTGVSALLELEARGDSEAAYIVKSLSNESGWRKKFRG